MDAVALQCRWADLPPGAHVCGLAASPEERREAVASFVRSGLERGERCLHLVAPPALPEARAGLGGAGVDVEAEEGRGSLRFLLLPERPSPDGTGGSGRLAGLLETAHAEALADGYTALRIVCDVWPASGAAPAPDTEGGAERTLEREALLDRFLSANPARALCLCDLRGAPPDVVRAALRTHPYMDLGGWVCRNPYHEPWAAPPPIAEGVAWMLDQLREGAARDATAQRVARALRTLSSCTAAMVRAGSEAALFDEVCRVLVEEGRYRLAWVGLAEAGPERHVRPVAWAGDGADYVARADIRWSDTPRGRGPTGRAIRERRIQVARDILTDPAFEPWRADAAAHGYAASLTLPLLLEDALPGALMVYASDPRAFDDEEVGLMAELARNLTFGISALRARESWARDRALLEEAQALAHLGNWELIHANGKLTWSAETYRIFGLDPGRGAALTYEAFLGYVHPEDREALDRVYRDSVKACAPYSAEHRICLPDGSVRFVHERGSTRHDPDGRPLRSVGTVQDVTAAKHAEAALRESEDRYRYVFEHSLVGKSLTLPDGRLGVNQAFCDMLGYSREEMVGRTWREITHPDDVAASEELVRALLSGEAPAGRVLKRYLHKDGHAVWVDLTIRLRRDEDGTPLYFLTSALDVTERIQAQEEVRRLNAELELRVQRRTAELAAANQELRAFSYSVSHDLRAPLRALDGFSNALLEDFASALDDRGVRYLKKIRDASQRMGQLIDDLLQLSRVTQHELCPTEVDLSAVARDVAADLRRSAPGRAVRWSIAPGLRARGDAGLLRIVLQNLLGNAWKYTSKHDHAHVEFGVEARDGEGAPAFFVRDDGAGFDMRYANKLFGAFQRLHTVEEFEGTGIGLATVQRIVHRHGGRVWAEGAVEGGACLYFTLGWGDGHGGGQADPAG